jgi:hypothetical protein
VDVVEGWGLGVPTRGLVTQEPFTMGDAEVCRIRVENSGPGYEPFGREVRFPMSCLRSRPRIAQLSATIGPRGEHVVYALRTDDSVHRFCWSKQAWTRLPGIPAPAELPEESGRRLRDTVESIRAELVRREGGV